MTKQEIRTQYLAIRNAMTDTVVREKSDSICKKLMLLPEYIEADSILLYADFKNEVQTKMIFEDGIKRKKKLYFPKCLNDGIMRFYQVISVQQLKVGAFGIYEPEERDVLMFYRSSGA